MSIDDKEVQAVMICVEHAMHCLEGVDVPNGSHSATNLEGATRHLEDAEMILEKITETTFEAIEHDESGDTIRELTKSRPSGPIPNWWGMFVRNVCDLKEKPNGTDIDGCAESAIEEWDWTHPPKQSA